MTTNTAWTYEWTQSNRTGTRSMRVGALDTAAQTVTLVTTWSWVQNPGPASQSVTRTEVFICNDDGLYLIERRTESNTTIAGTPDIDTAVTVYNPPAFIRPNALELDDGWTSTAKGTTTHTNGDPDDTFDNRTDHTVTEVGVRFPDVVITGLGCGIQAVKVEGGSTCGGARASAR